MGQSQKTLENCLSSPDFLNRCESFSKTLTETFKNDKNLFVCGNGGSHCDALHFAEELTGRFRKNRRALGALALGEAAHLTCTSNDYGFSHVFARQLEGLARPGDMFVGISTSGNSQNVIEAVEVARKKGLKTAALLGKDGGKLKEIVDLALVVPSDQTERIQEMHIKIIHVAIESMERQLFPENY